MYSEKLKKSSRIPNFYKLTPDKRLKIIKEFASLTEEEIKILKDTGALDLGTANMMIENVIGVAHLPIGIATNFLINNKDYLVPMAIEEPSVVAAASHGAKMTREGGGIFAESTESIMIGQIQVVDVKDPYKAKSEILNAKEDILMTANKQDPVLISLGGGARDLDVRIIETIKGQMLIVHLYVDVKDAMGANIVNTMAESIAPVISRITGGKVYLRIVTNLADKRLVRARTIVPKKAVGGEEVVDGIVYAYAFAAADPYRAATHNKGIMNGIDAVAIATGQDWRAIEAGAHAYAARFGKYMPLSTWDKNEKGDLVGTIELPLAVGIVGGTIRTNPIAKICLKILGVKNARELAEVMAAVGLTQNLAALRALVTEGIQRGHMKLHAKNIAMMAGAKGEEIDFIAKIMVETGTIRVDVAKHLLEKLRQGSNLR